MRFRRRYETTSACEVSARAAPGYYRRISSGRVFGGRLRLIKAMGAPLLLEQRLMVCLPRYGDTEPVAQDLHGGPASGVEGHVPLSGSEGDLYRAVSAATAAGGGALPRSAGLNVNPDTDETMCIACDLCALACPENLIVVSSERNEKTRRKELTNFTYDLSRCMFCGFCEDAVLRTRSN